MRRSDSSNPPRCFGRIHENGSVELDSEEAHHLQKVLRVRAGDPVEVLDGSRLVLAEALAGERRGLALRLVRELEPEKFGAVPIRLCVAVLHPPAMERLVRLATELHVARISLLVTAHTQHAEPPRNVIHRWQRVAREACKQARRVEAPDIETPIGLESLLRESPGPGTVRLALTPRHAELGARELGQLPVPSEVWLAQGPEGGWTSEELAAMKVAGFTTWTLGRAIFRAETCPAVALSLIHEHFGTLFSASAGTDAGPDGVQEREEPGARTGDSPELPAD